MKRHGKRWAGRWWRSSPPSSCSSPFCALWAPAPPSTTSPLWNCVFTIPSAFQRKPRRSTGCASRPCAPASLSWILPLLPSTRIQRKKQALTISASRRFFMLCTSAPEAMGTLSPLRTALSPGRSVSARFSWRAAIRRRRQRRPTLPPSPSRIWEPYGKISPPWV